MFARGNWAIVGLNPDSLPAFQESLNTRKKALAVSQLAAALVTRTANRDSFGINPFSEPRLDEKHPFDETFVGELVNFALGDDDFQQSRILPDEIHGHPGYARTGEDFAISPNLDRFGLWFVTNTYKDVSHAASIREQAAYDTFARPVKFLNSEDKKAVDAAARVATAAIRKQFPVLVDFQSGRVSIESTNKNDIQSVLDILAFLGAETYPLAWSFEVEGHWPTKALTQIFADTKYSQEFHDRAEEAKRFSPSEIEKHENPEIQKLVTRHFASTNLGGDTWASLSAPAAIALHSGSAPIVVQTPTNATTLLGMTSGASVVSAGVTLQERLCVAKKDGSERVVRKDVFSFEINDSLNITDVGAATLRGFDLPSFKSSIMREIRKSNTVPPLSDLWHRWLIEMNQAVVHIQAELLELLGIPANAEDSGLIRSLAGDEVDGGDLVIEIGEGAGE